MFLFFEHPLTQAVLTLIVMVAYFEFRIKRRRFNQKVKDQNILDAIIDHFKETTELKTNQFSEKQVYAKVRELMKEADTIAKSYDPKAIWELSQYDIGQVEKEIRDIKTHLEYLEAIRNENPTG